MPSAEATELCVEMGYAARFDGDDLTVETIRYFHDAEDTEPFAESAVQRVPTMLLKEVGYFVLPVRRTWESTISFASELFRKAVGAAGSMPSKTILQERDRLRRPPTPLESDPALEPLVEAINARLRSLLPDAPQLGLRLTATDAESLLRSLVPHYTGLADLPVPAGRAGTGLLSLQTFILLLEIGRGRKERGESFILALEEPEIHVPPGLQRRLIADAIAASAQTIATSHSPRVAGFLPATGIHVLESDAGHVRSTPMLASPLGESATSAQRKLFNDDRVRVLEALTHRSVLVPEGRSELEWFRLLADAVETGDRAFAKQEGSDVPPFGAVVGVVPVHSAAVVETVESLGRLRGGISALVDGDDAGDEYVKKLLRLAMPPKLILQWQEGWFVEDAIGWILQADADSLEENLSERLDYVGFADLDDLVDRFKVKKGERRLKTDYLAYEEVGAAVRETPAAIDRAELVLQAVTLACLGRHDESPLLAEDERSTTNTRVLRIAP